MPYHVATWRKPRLVRGPPKPPDVQPLFAARERAAAERDALRRRRALAGAALVARYRAAAARRRRALAANAAGRARRALGQVYNRLAYDRDYVRPVTYSAREYGFDLNQAVADAADDWAEM